MKQTTENYRKEVEKKTQGYADANSSGSRE